MEETLDFSQTQRIVFLIDLHPLFNHQNPNSNYISSVLASVRTLLNFSPLSNSLFAVKFFFSSLPPISSSSKLISLLGKSSLFFSFNRPEETLVSLSQTLDSLSNLSETLCLPPRASLIAISLRQLVHDYGWESRAQDLVGTSTVIRSNLVVLFSPVSRSIQCLSEFMGVEINDDDAFSGRFDGIFGSLSERFVSTDIHFSWIDVNFERESEEERVVKDESLLAVGLIERGVKRLGWGFCSTDAITLGSALVPFGLIYPKIGCSLMGTDYSRKVWVELSLSILDVNGNPLDCNCCNLELSDVKLLTKQSYKDISCLWESKKEITGDCHQVRATTNDVGDQVLKICVKEVWMNTENMKIKEGLCDFALLRGLSGGAVEDQTGKSSGDFFADKVLEMLRMESTEFTPGKPIWQVFLSFLYKRSYWALVFISDGNGLSLMGVLKPFTIHSAVLCIFDKQTSHNLVNDIDGLSSSLVHIVAKKYNKIPKADGELNHENKLTSSQDSKTKHKRKGSKVFQDLSWSSFCEAARNRCEMDLEEVYFARECRDSKKMRFLKCWIKQNTKSSRCLQIEPNESKSMPGLDDEMKKRLARRELDCEQSVSSSFSSEELSLTGSSPNKNEEATPAFCPETSETFFSCMSGRIEKGLDSKEIELGALAERLVNSSVYWLYRKHDESDNNAENPTSSERPKEDYNGSVAAELGELLLRDPKDLAAKYRSCEPPSLTLNPSPALNILEVKVRDYELQILFRMEILRSKAGANIVESARRKMVKQICSLIETIQCHHAEGFFGDFTLDKYVERTIKNRYSHALGDIVHRIYSRLDLFMFDNDDVGETLGPLQNSKDCNAELREKEDENEIDKNDREGKASTSGSLNHKGNNRQSPGGIKNNLQHSLLKAHERRERARRFGSFPTRILDLQRVWAPKQPQAAMKLKSESLSKHPKRKKQQGHYDVVCETPIKGKKRSFTRNIARNEEQANFEIDSCASVSKALFQDTDT